MAARPAWQRDVHEGLYALAAARAPLLRARPPSWGEVSVALVADLAGMQTTGTDGRQPARIELEDMAVSRLLQHFQGHIHAMSIRCTRGASDVRVELSFDETPEAEAAQLSAVDDQQIVLPQTQTEPAMSIPVRLGAGQIISPHLVQLVLHGLPARLCRQGMGQTLLTAAGYPPQEYSVAGEFLGDLPARFSGCHAAAGVGNSDACLVYIAAPAADRRLTQLPRYFFVGTEKVFISRPGQLKQPPAGLSSQQPSSQPAPSTSPSASGPRLIRVRQRTSAAARTSQSLASQPGSTQLQALEAHVRNSRTPGADRSGLGRTFASQQAPVVPAFVPAVDTQPPVPMDCQPPASAEVLDPIAQPTAMDLDAAQQPPSPSSSPMDCDTQELQPSSQHSQASDTLERQLLGVSMDMVDACFEWLSVHTHYSVPAIRAAFLHLYAAEPSFLRGSPSEAAVQHRLVQLLEEQSDGGPSQPATHCRRPHPAPRIPPGFELQAAQMAAAAALAGLAAPRRSARSRRQPGDWWASQQTAKTTQHSRGPSSEGRRPCHP